MSVTTSVGPRLKTSALLLEPVGDADVAALARHWGEEAVARYLWIDQPVTLEMVSDIVTTSNRDFRCEGYGVWAARHTQEDALIGICGLRRVAGTDWVEILFSLRQRYWGQGWGTQAAFAVLEHAFGSLSLSRVVAMVDPRNAALALILKRANMSPFQTRNGKTYWEVERARFHASSRRPPPPIELA